MIGCFTHLKQLREDRYDLMTVGEFLDSRMGIQQSRSDRLAWKVDALNAIGQVFSFIATFSYPASPLASTFLTPIL
jgi:hypothetical protein